MHVLSWDGIFMIYLATKQGLKKRGYKYMHVLSWDGIIMIYLANKQGLNGNK